MEPNETTPRTTVRVKTLQRASRGLDVVPRDPERGRYLVASASQPGVFYAVDLQPAAFTGRCTCPWGQYGGANCKHVMAALRAHYTGQGRLSFWRTLADARRQHRRTVKGEGIYATLRPRRAR
ncbi:MAG TPA: SWIM zinc finger family protein [Roseiflexaceae bacterium]|nr:SWIM zinc finger family protein [Roseiflexaceae bacterium]